MVDRPADRRMKTDIPSVAKSSKPTEHEPNGTPEEATPVELGKELRPIAGTIESASDVDWFQVRSAADTTASPFELIVRPLDKGLDVGIHIQIPGQELVPLIYNIAGSGEPESVPIIRVSDQPLRFGLRGEDGTSGAYELQFVRRLSGGALEMEPNDHPVVATSLGVPGQVQGFFDRPSDRDVFALEVLPEAENAVLSFDFRPVANLNQIARVYADEPLEKPLFTMQIPGHVGTSVSLPNFRVPAEVDRLWLVLTAGEGFDRKSSYIVGFRQTPDTANDLELEPNDKLAQGVPVPSKIRGFLHSASDVDRFVLGVSLKSAKSADMGAIVDAAQVPQQLDVPDLGAQDMDAGLDMAEVQAPLELPNKPAGEPILLLLAEPARDGVKIGGVLSGVEGEHRLEAGMDGRIQSCSHAYHRGELEFWLNAVELTDGRGPGVDYRVSFGLSSDLEGFEQEPNDDTKTADTLVTDRTGVFATPGDKDVYAFAVNAGLEDVSVRVEVETAHPVSVLVMDQEGGVISKGAAERGKSVVEVDLPRGIYLVQVQSTSGPSCETYKIRLESQIPSKIESGE